MTTDVIFDIERMMKMYNDVLCFVIGWALGLILFIGLIKPINKWVDKFLKWLGQ